MRNFIHNTIAGINSVHTYAAHKAVHTMALAQQQYSSSNSIIQSAAPSSVVVVENNTVTPHRTAVGTPTSQKLSPQTMNPLRQQVASASGQLASPSKDNESGNEGRGRGGRDHSREREQRGEGRPIKGKEKRADVNIASTIVTMVTSSNSDSNHIKHQAAAASSNEKEYQRTVVATASPLTTVVAASNPHNFLLPGTTPAALTSPPISSPAMALGGLNLSALPTAAPLTISALSNQLLASTGLPAAGAITATGISTPTGGLLSPILYGNNPFLTVLGSSPSLSIAAASSQPAAASLLQATAATLNQPTAQTGTNVGGVNLQLIKQLQEKINAHLQAIPSNQRGDIGSAGASMLATAAQGGFGRTPLQQALLASGLDHGLSKRERLLESMLMSKTPVYCIASPPEVLASDVLKSEHTIEYIDTRRKISNSRCSSGNESGCSAENEPVTVSDGGNLDQKPEIAKESRGGQSSTRAVGSQSLMSSRTTEAEVTNSLIRGCVSNNTHLLASPSLSTVAISKTTPISSSQAATVTARVAHPQALSGLSLLNTTPSFSLPTTAQIQQQTGFPLLSYTAAVPPTTAAALTPTFSSPLKGYYIMLNPLATAAAGAAVAGGSAAVQPIMIAAAAGGTAAASPTVCGGTTAIQVPGLTAAASLVFLHLLLL